MFVKFDNFKITIKKILIFGDSKMRERKRNTLKRSTEIGYFFDNIHRLRVVVLTCIIFYYYPLSVIYFRWFSAIFLYYDIIASCAMPITNSVVSPIDHYQPLSFFMCFNYRMPKFWHISVYVINKIRLLSFFMV